MQNKTLSYISLGASLVALVFSIIVLVKYCPTQNLQFDYMGVIVGILAILVTALIGAQVGQYVFVDRKIESISKPITRIIARKVAAEVAHRQTPELAKAAALDAIDLIVSDFSLIMKSQDLLYRAKNNIMFSEYMSAIDNIFEAIAIFVQCKNDKMSEPSITESFRYLEDAFERCKNHGGARILLGRKPFYIDVLKDIRLDTSNILQYLNEARQMPKDTDYKIRENEDKECIDRMMRGEDPTED